MTTITDTVAYLIKNFGEPTVVAFIANERDRSLISLWKTGEATPSKSECERLTVAAEVLRKVATELSDEEARGWFLGINVRPPMGEEMTPMQAIREGLFDAARASATRLVTDSYY